MIVALLLTVMGGCGTGCSAIATGLTGSRAASSGGRKLALGRALPLLPRCCHVAMTKGKNFRTYEVERTFAWAGKGCHIVENILNVGLLDIVEEYLPFGAEQWESVAAMYNEHLPASCPERDGDSLKRKFLGLKTRESQRVQ